jgi:hypothetical protein
MPHNLDPIRAIVSVITNSDVLIRASNAAGLRVNLTTAGDDNWSHATRIRALVPRVFDAYDALTDEERIAATQAAFASLADQGAAEGALNRLGWRITEGQIAVSAPDVREVFIPRGSQWDAFVVLRSVFAEAHNTLLIVDPYCGRIAVLSRYPSTDVDVDRAIRAAAVTNRVAGLISVCASGRLRDRMRNAFAWMGPQAHWSLDSIVDLIDGQPSESGQNRSWATVRHSSGGPIEVYERDCKLCQTFSRSILVPIDPIAFDAYLPTMRERHTLKIADAAENRELWNACQRSQCLTLEATPDEHIRPFRPTKELLPIKVNVDRLLDDNEFRAVAVLRLKRLAQKQPDLARVDLVLCPDPNAPGIDRALEIVGEALGTKPTGIRCPIDPWPEDLRNNIQKAACILVLSPGTVTGFSLQRTLAGVQEIRRGTMRDYRVLGLTIHARPARVRDWETLKNSYAGELHSLFLSHWPRFIERGSPIQEEADIVESINPELLSRPAREIWELRRAFCAGKAPGTPLFWGQADDQRLSAHSIFGDALDATTTYAAVASAMHARRQMEITRPYRLSFELPAIFRSYYDPLIVASVLRWIRPTEAWWGETPTGAEIVLADLFARTVGMPPLATMLAAELLLAGGLGKIPAAALRDVVVPEAHRLYDVSESPVLEVALSLPALKSLH